MSGASHLLVVGKRETHLAEGVSAGSIVGLPDNGSDLDGGSSRVVVASLYLLEIRDSRVENPTTAVVGTLVVHDLLGGGSSLETRCSEEGLVLAIRRGYQTVGTVKVDAVGVGTVTDLEVGNASSSLLVVVDGTVVLESVVGDAESEGSGGSDLGHATVDRSRDVGGGLDSVNVLSVDLIDGLLANHVNGHVLATAASAPDVAATAVDTVTTTTVGGSVGGIAVVTMVVIVASDANDNGITRLRPEVIVFGIDGSDPVLGIV